MNYNIDNFDNHLIINDHGKKFLIDTGAPVSFSNETEINIFEQTYRASQSYLGFSIEKLNEEIKYDLDALIGGNILKNHIFQVDCKNKLFSVLNEISLDNTQEYIDLDFQMDIPIIEIGVEKKTKRAFLDTGAKISYLNRKLVKHLEEIEIREDFHPTLGRFQTPIYKIPMILNEREISLEFGVLPEKLESGLLVTGIEAIVGNDIFSFFSLIFNYSDKKIYFALA